MLIGNLPQNVVNALSLSMVYMLVAMGLTLILSIMSMINFAHGDLYMLGGFGVYTVCQQLGYKYWLGLTVGVAAAALIGIFLEKAVFRPLRKEMLSASFASMGAGLIIQSCVLMAFGPLDKKVASVFPGVFKIFGVYLPKEKLAIILASLAIVGAIIVFVNYFRAGQALQAVAQDSEAASLMGMDVNRVNAVGFGLGCALAAAAGALIAPLYFVSPSMGVTPLTKAFNVVIIGGLGSIPGAMLGSLLMGFVDQFSLIYMGHLGNIFGFLLIMAFLLFRPRGLLGRDVKMH